MKAIKFAKSIKFEEKVYLGFCENLKDLFFADNFLKIGERYYRDEDVGTAVDFASRALTNLLAARRKKVLTAEEYTSLSESIKYIRDRMLHKEDAHKVYDKTAEISNDLFKMTVDFSKKCKW